MTQEGWTILAKKGRRDLKGAHLQYQDLHGMDLTGADLRGADLTGADLRNAILDNIICGNSAGWKFAKPFLAVLVVLLLGRVAFLSTSALESLIYDDDYFSVHNYIFRGILLFSVITLCGLLILWRGSNWGIVLFSVLLCSSATLGLIYYTHNTPIKHHIPGDFSPVGAIIPMLNAGIDEHSSAVVSFFSIGIIAQTVVILFICAASIHVNVIFTAFCLVIYAAGHLTVDNGMEAFLFLALFNAGPKSVLALLLLNGISFFIGYLARSGNSRFANIRNIYLWINTLGGTKFRDANLADASLKGADLRGASFINANLEHCLFQRAKFINRAHFPPGSLRNFSILPLIALGHSKGSLRNLDLRNMVIRDADLHEADLTGANLSGTDLQGTDITLASSLNKTSIDAETYLRSGWSPNYLKDLQSRGVEIISINQLPDEAQDLILGAREGLALYFDRRLGAWDHLMIQAVITAELGTETDCRMIEMKEPTSMQGQRCGDDLSSTELDTDTQYVLVRLKANLRDHLLRIADRLYRCSYERQKQQVHLLVDRTRTLEEQLAQQKREQQSLTQGLSRKAAELEQALMIKDLEHRTVVTKLVQLFQEQTASNLQRMELHEPMLGSSLPAMGLPVRSPTHCSIIWEPNIGKVQTEPRLIRIAVLAAPKDARHRSALLRHLSGLYGSNLIEILHDELVLPGANLSASLAKIIEIADIVLCLMSADFLGILAPITNDEDGFRKELTAAVKAALARRAKDGLIVIPVLLRPVSLEDTVFGKLNPLPSNAVPILKWSDYDEALKNVVTGVRRYISTANK